VSKGEYRRNQKKVPRGHFMDPKRCVPTHRLPWTCKKMGMVRGFISMGVIDKSNGTLFCGNVTARLAKRRRSAKNSMPYRKPAKMDGDPRTKHGMGVSREDVKEVLGVKEVH